MGADASCIISNEINSPDETPLLRSPLMDKENKSSLMTRFPDLPECGTIEDLFQYPKSVAGAADF